MLIGLTGYMGSGKSTVADCLIDRATLNECTACKKGALTVKLLPMAAPLKDFAFKLGWDGVKDEKGRRLLQLLGTECGRECIAEDIWLNHWKESYFSERNFFDLIIVDDIRFEDEASLIRRFGGLLVHITRPGYSGDGHVSEKGLKYYVKDTTLNNMGTLADLTANVSVLWSKEVN